MRTNNFTESFGEWIGVIIVGQQGCIAQASLWQLLTSIIQPHGCGLKSPHDETPTVLTTANSEQIRHRAKNLLLKNASPSASRQEISFQLT
ncbi:Protein of unknown function [Pyronema omphalodes CBS 100304]|uniref:Uncharacterized protein n=1 Tax=Pyronema omphalodes (strain CBS 100304) TaxID=1076935 RepID=U4LM97_PYROM|nr:Protein of unknown function [Pyronema omphalodes CBS 100304]